MLGSSASARAALSSADHARVGALWYETLAASNNARNQPLLSLRMIPPDALHKIHSNSPYRNGATLSKEPNS